MSSEAKPMSRTQLNLRVSETLEMAIDAKRAELLAELGVIPTRSDLLRMALAQFLGMPLSETEVDGRAKVASTTSKAS